ncbi:pimeloyl-[acyl-carrier protein] methyl ester esterase [Vreelandella subterranea]|uniref:Pimeloyl-[acyl-carrier protein] methyl ester esterase n=1 Tax=Vreelandella subterranea TaxID=416874 RepID=A0A1H9U3J5_9GAMM|nr:alpha/beta fold hydrolase [Halomonas subterranea]SES04075.1 pimeloyl-[acyl-carrier protein] methyl ester esterase [Halomonas subterranea]
MPRPSSQRLVLLSGWGIDQRIWQPLEGSWPASVEAHAVDWPGYGDAPALPDNATLDQLASTMARQLPSDAIWVGWSLGGLLATALLDHLPLPRGLILLGVGERFYSDDGVTSSELASFRHAFARDPHATWRHFLRWQTQGEPNARQAHRQLRALQGDTPSANRSTLAQGLDWLATIDNSQRLRNAPCPVKRLIGEHDPLVGTSVRNEAETLAKAGHCPMLSQPVQLADALAAQAFLAVEEQP